MAQQEAYKDLVDAPNETLSVEYKSWLDLTDDAEARADLARHICAIANHGGGMIVFGFNDDITPSGPNPFPKAKINRDTISAIVKKYLEPTFHCDVVNIESDIGNTHPIVIVPSHGSTPICTKASGPVVNGKARGIALGTHYVRKPGPESDKVMTAAEWAPIIRRCASMNGRASLARLKSLCAGASPHQRIQLKTRETMN